ncbi:hypothetical protein QR680_009307 [Steinernema hermaphroditum]|uniref:RNA-directed DNA polymerase n=1 Tax=Steinernema hermaphroditum TaxID=289476 RepID=A0AA39M9P4_9BILA|nr:hypothetical protein QR680_009307 [Steinernema hermaphroditum]
MPFTMMEGTPIDFAPNERINELLQQVQSASAGMNENLWTAVAELVTEFAGSFAISDSELAQTDLVTHKIDTESNAPIKGKARQIPYPMKEKVMEMVQQYLRQGIIRRSHSPWASPLVLVRKKDGSIRMCVDYRKLNAVTVKDAYPTPHIYNLLSSFHNRRVFTTFDLHSGYWQIRMEADSIEKTAFSSPCGLYEFTVMPFGLTNAVATFQRFIGSLFHDVLNRFVFVYIDDILVASESWEEHVEHLRLVLTRISEAGLRLKAKKCRFARQEVPFLGHLLTTDGVRIDPDKVAPIRAYPIPTNVTELQRFIGLASYNRKFVFGFAKIAGPLFAATKKGTIFSWGDDQQKALDTLKTKLCDEVTLKFPDYKAAELDEKRRFIIMTDASTDGLGGVFCQPDEQHHLRPIHFVSRRCSEAERKYSATDLEALAIYFAISKLRQYIIDASRTITVLTDHRPLEGMFRKGISDNKRTNRILAELIPHYRLEIKYLEGKKNVIADALSRAIRKASAPAPNTVYALQYTEEEWKEALGEDPQLERLRSSLCPAANRTVTADSLAEAKAFCTDKGILYYVDDKGKRYKVVPAKFRIAILRDIHAGPLGVHASAPKLYELLSREYYWPNARTDCEKVCMECEVCGLNRVARNTTQPLEPIVSSRAMELVCIDLLKIGPSRNGNLYIAVMTDHFSKYLVATPIPDKSAATVAKAITTDWILQFGPPTRIHSDQGTEFCNSVLDFLCESFGIIRSTTSAYHPQCNGVTERVNRDLIAMLRKSPISKFDWDDRLPFAVYAHNVMVHRSTKCSPYALVYGREPSIPVIIRGQNAVNPAYTVDVDTYRCLLEEQISLLSAEENQHLTTARYRMKDGHDRAHRAKNRDFALGDFVYVKRPGKQIRRAKCAKIDPVNEGPFEIIELLRSAAVLRRPNGKKETIRLDRLTKATVSRPVSTPVRVSTVISSCISELTMCVNGDCDACLFPGLDYDEEDGTERMVEEQEDDTAKNPQPSTPKVVVPAAPPTKETAPLKPTGTATDQTPKRPTRKRTNRQEAP